MNRIQIILLLLVHATAAGVGGPDEGRRILDAADVRAREINSYRCRYESVIEIDDLDIRTSGTMLYLRPGHLRMDFRTVEGSGAPTTTLSVTDGIHAWIETGSPGSSRPVVIRSRARGGGSIPDGSSVSSLTGMLPQLRALFELRLTGDEVWIEGQLMHVFEGHYRKGALSEMIARDNASAGGGNTPEIDLTYVIMMESILKSVRVWVGELDLVPHRVIVNPRDLTPGRSRAGAELIPRTVTTYRAIEFEPAIDPGHFVYTPPEGVRVIDRAGP